LIGEDGAAQTADRHCSRLFQMIAGSVSDAVLRKVCCPVMLVPRRRRAHHRL